MGGSLSDIFLDIILSYSKLVLISKLFSTRFPIQNLDTRPDLTFFHTSFLQAI